MGRDISGATPKVSVVIPVYDTEGYIGQTMRSVMAQTLRDIEIIAIDDGSTDHSLAVMERIAAEDARVKVLTQENRGLSLTRNRGIAEAQGGYVYFMDSDDLLDADTLELCYEKCERERLDVVIFDADVFGDGRSYDLGFDYRRSALLEDKVYAGPDFMRAQVETGAYRSSACMYLARLRRLRELDLTFYPGILHEDELFTPQLMMGARRAGRIDRAFFHRRLRGGSIMAAPYSARTIAGYKTVLLELDAFCMRTPDSGIVRRRMREVLNAVVWRAAQMDRRARMDLLGWVLGNFPFTVTPKNMVKLLTGK